MTKLNELIAELCPDGVEYKTLGEVAKVTSGSSAPQDISDFSENGTPFCRTSDVGKVHLSVDFDAISDKITDSAAKKMTLMPRGTILIPKSGASTLLNHKVRLNIEAYVVSHLAAIIPNKDIINDRFLYYALTRFDMCQLVEDRSYPSVKTSDIAKEIEIPVPPLAVQEEIVRILDKFTSLTAELTARRAQYEYYRDALLTPPFAYGYGKQTDLFAPNGTHDKNVRHSELADFRCRPRFDSESANEMLKQVQHDVNDNGKSVCEYKKLGEIATITRGGNFQKKDFVESGFPCIHYGQMYTHFGTWADKPLTFVSKEVYDKSKLAQPNDIVMAVTSENVEDVCKCTAWLGNVPVAVSGHTAIIHHNQNAKYLSYYFHSSLFYNQKVKLAHGTKVIEVTPDKLNDITIPLPPLPVQQRIVSVLDNFDAICADLKIGLPAEIEARKKQYEYYRDLLLTFAERGNTILNRTEQNRTEQNRTEQNRTEQNRTEQNRTEQNRTDEMR